MTRFQSLAIDQGGQIVAGGYTDNGSNWDFALARYDQTGTLDSSFGTTGLVTTPIGTSDDQIQSLAIDSAGRIVVAGRVAQTVTPLNSHIGIARFAPDGTFDPTFGNAGIVVTSIGTSNDAGWAAAIESTGKIMLVGHSFNGSNLDFALTRYLSESFQVVPGASSRTFTEDEPPLTIDNAIGLTNSPNANIRRRHGPYRQLRARRGRARLHPCRAAFRQASIRLPAS